MESLYQQLLKYKEKNYYPMHMPGHKQNTVMCEMDNPYKIDITEIEGFDNLHEAEGVLKESMKRASRIYGSDYTDFLINGSTAGLLTGIAACTKRGDKIIIARNCHKSVYNAVFLNDLKPIYVYPQMDRETGVYCGILSENLEDLLIKNPDTKLVVITSPTYEGVISDIERIAQMVHSFHIPLMVDEAHGAHLGHCDCFPINSIKCGADIVIQSVHKTLPSFTQTALIHVNGKKVDYGKIKNFLSIYQSSSPSYILLAGIDLCMELLEKQGSILFYTFYENLTRFYDKMEELKYLKVYKKSSRFGKYGGYDFDFSKIIILTNDSSISGKELYDILLEKYRIQVEMVSKDYVLAITTICDKEEGFKRLEEALISIDNSISYGSREWESCYTNICLPMELTSYEAYNRQGEEILLERSIGRITKDYIYLYPPGIPIIVPGEKITEELLFKLQEYRACGMPLKGMKRDGFIEVVM